MVTYDIEKLDSIRELVSAAHATNEPVTVFDGEDECLVALTPALFERILVDGTLLNAEGRDTLRF